MMSLQQSLGAEADGKGHSLQQHPDVMRHSTCSFFIKKKKSAREKCN